MRNVAGLAGFGVIMALGACAEGEGGIGMAALGGGDDCGAEARQGLVGTSIGSLDAATLPEDRRVIFPGMAVTQEYRADRLNVAVGEDDTISRVYCG